MLCTVCRLPERIRPSACAFGSLADTFLPFQLQDGSTAEIHPASIVMKSVQARLVQPTAAQGCRSGAPGSAMEGCGKLGDDADQGKAQAGLPARTGTAQSSQTVVADCAGHNIGVGWKFRCRADDVALTQCCAEP